MVFNRFHALVAACVLVSALAGCSKDVSDEQIVRIGSGEVRQWIEDGAGTKGSKGLIVDARTPDVFEKGHLPRAINLRAEQLRAAPKTGHVTDYKTVIVYGEDPASSSAKSLVKRLILMDVSKVRWYAGGYREWSSLNLPTAKPGGTPSPGAAAPKPVAPAAAASAAPEKK